MKFSIRRPAGLPAILLLLLLLLTGAVISGCGVDAGAVGDANDPAKTTDVEQMQDETDKNALTPGK